VDVVQGVVAPAAYAVGQLVASGSALVFERILVGRLLGYRGMAFSAGRRPGRVRAAPVFQSFIG
jgi:hypothetical protein